jgi:hypothetical protein
MKSHSNFRQLIQLILLKIMQFYLPTKNSVSTTSALYTLDKKKTYTFFVRSIYKTWNKHYSTGTKIYIFKPPKILFLFLLTNIPNYFSTYGKKSGETSKSKTNQNHWKKKVNLNDPAALPWPQSG